MGSSHSDVLVWLQVETCCTSVVMVLTVGSLPHSLPRVIVDTGFVMCVAVGGCHRVGSCAAVPFYYCPDVPPIVGNFGV